MPLKPNGCPLSTPERSVRLSPKLRAYDTPDDGANMMAPTIISASHCIAFFISPTQTDMADVISVREYTT